MKSNGDKKAHKHLSAVATGNWGCGAFRGNVRLKALLQMMVCSAVGRDIVYYTFGDTRLRDLLHSIHNFLDGHSITVCQLWRYLCKFNEAQLPPRHLYPFIQQAHLESVNLLKVSLKNQATETEYKIETVRNVDKTFASSSRSSEKSNIIPNEVSEKYVLEIKQEENQNQNRVNKEDIQPKKINEAPFSCDIIDASQPELDFSRSYVSELRKKKTKLVRNEEACRKNHKTIKSFLYSSDEEENETTVASSSGLLDAMDTFQEENKLEITREENKMDISQEESEMEISQTINIDKSTEITEEYVKLEEKEVVQEKQQSVDIRENSKTVSSSKQSTHKVEKTCTNRKISDYFKVIPK